MHIEKNIIDYGIYIDHKTAFIISLNSLQNEKFIAEEIEKNHNPGAENISGSTDFSREKQMSLSGYFLKHHNRIKQELLNYCKRWI